MKQSKIVMLALVSMMALPAFADESKEAVLAPTPDQSQLKQELKQEKKTIKITREKVAQDKASGNVEQLKIDKNALKVARREKRLLKKRIHKDRKEKLENKGEVKPSETHS